MAPTSRCPVLPDEIMEDEILARLPAKSVFACRCVSRAWAAALSSDDFADRYNAIHGGRPKILRVQDSSDGDRDRDRDDEKVVTVAVTGDCFPRFVTVFWEETPVDRPTHPCVATTQCRGLVILEHVPTGIHFLCNPSTGQNRALPEGRTTGCRRPGDHVQRYASLGLGYDARARRHKVVRVYYRGGDDEGRPASFGCEVYVVNDSTESWRPIAARPAGWVKQAKPSVFAQGHVYWLAYRNLGYRQEEIGMIIVRFSVCEETFATVPPPPGIQDELLHEWRCLTELAGRLCLFSGGNRAGYENQYDVWLLHEHGQGTVWDWDLHCRIEAGTASPEVNRVMRGNYDSYGQIDIIPLALTDNGRRILLTGSAWPDDIWAYTPSTGEIETVIGLKSLVGRNNWLLEVAVYEESIAHPGRQPRGDIVLTSSPSTQAMWFVLRLLSERTLRRLMCVCRSWENLIATELWYHTHAR
ncbi:hypothetical protein ZWY2020_001003 [Hordeum vulgare]|nr:hypothetical protein ZWY2020_001003 [Hordeum vulgare]